MRRRLAAAVISVTATSAQAGSVEWTRRRGGSSSIDALGYIGSIGGAGFGLSTIHANRFKPGRKTLLRRPRSELAVAPQPLSMQLEAELSPPPPANLSESMDYKRRSVIRALFNDNAKEVSGWMKTLKSLDGPEMPFDEMLELDKSIQVSREKTERRHRRYRHFDLRRNPKLLTKTEEIELGRKVQKLLRWERVRNYLELRLGRPATMGEWATELGATDRVEDLEKEISVMKAARDRMISCNLRLVLHIARKKFYTGASGTLKVSLEDMIQDGTAGLVKAVERFDPEKGFRFSTYATWWVHQAIHCGFADCGRVIRLPMNLHTMVCKVVRLQNVMVDQLGREPSVEELSLESGLEERQVKKCLRVSKVEPVSLDGCFKPLNGQLHHNMGGTREKMGDSILSVHEPELVDGADVSLLQTDVKTILGDLSAREAYVLRMRFGIGGNSPSTLEMVGQQLHVTRERVRQIQVSAIKKLRRRSIAREALYSDRAVAWDKGDGALMNQWERGGDHHDDDHGDFCGVPSASLIGLVKQALEPSSGEGGDRLVDTPGSAVAGGARRRVTGEVLKAERTRVAPAAAAAGGGLKVKAAIRRERSVGKRTREKVMVVENAHNSDGCLGSAGGDVGAGTGRQQSAAPPATKGPALQASLQAA